MRIRSRVAVAVAGAAVGVSLFAASSAWASGTPSRATCTSAGKTMACGSGWYTSQC